MHSHVLLFIQDLAMIMLVAGVMTILCHRFKQPIAFGYIFAGVLIGPHTPPFPLITDKEIIKTLAELGVIFLLFSLGLEFNLRKLAKVGLSAMIPAMMEIALMIWIGYNIGHTFGWSEMDALFLGAILAISSSTIIVKALADLKLKKKAFAQFIFAILIIEDIFAVLILALLSGVASTGSLDPFVVMMTTIQLIAFLVVSLLVGISIVPRILNYVAKFESNEMLLISVLGLCFGFCYLVSALDYSVALGAFVIGAIIAESKQLPTIEHLVEPIRDMFSAIFFVSVGLLFNPNVLVEFAWPIAIITLAIVLGKVISCALGALVTGHDGKTSLRVGMGLAQIGEFSFIIAALGIALGVTGQSLYSIAVAASIVTTLLTPYLIKYSDGVAKVIAKFIPNRIAAVSHVYIDWIKNLRPEDSEASVMRQVKSDVLFIAINLIIVVAVFLAGIYLAQAELGMKLIQVKNEYVRDSIIWSGAVLVSMPFIIAVIRRINHFSSTIIKIDVEDSVESQYSMSVRKIVAGIIPVISVLGITLLLLGLSIGILPPYEWLGMIVVFLIIVSATLYPWLVKLHDSLQKNLLKSLKKD